MGRRCRCMEMAELRSAAQTGKRPVCPRFLPRFLPGFSPVSPFVVFGDRGNALQVTGIERIYSIVRDFVLPGLAGCI